MSDTATRFRQGANRLHALERSIRRAELLEGMRRDALALIALSSEIGTPSETEQKVEQLLEKLQTEAEQWKRQIEENITLVLGMADNAAEVWEQRWAAALRNPATDRTEETKVLRSVLEETEGELREWLRIAQGDSRRFGRPLARLDELQARAAEFPFWARECLARWEMLDAPVPPLDPERVARAQAAYGRGDHEDLDDLLSRVEGGGPWVKE